MKQQSSCAQQQEQLILSPMVFSDDGFGEDKAKGQEQQ
jgi:hypothetical protein